MHFGIDPAARSLAIFAAGSSMTAVHKLATRETQRWRQIDELKFKLATVLDMYPPDAIFIEEPVLAGKMNIRSTILIAETVGMVLSCGVSTYLVPVSTWKKKVVGNGSASKQEVAQWLEKELPEYARLCNQDQDLIDAGAICEYGRQILEALGRPDLSGQP